MRVLLTGGRGLLGSAIRREFSAPGYDVVSPDRSSLDITDDRAVAAAVQETAPELVINCAAYNDVDGAESDPVAALAANAFAVRALSRAARAAGAVFVHYGSDFVFDGETDRPYTEDDQPNPRGVYAASKLLGEWFALDHPRGYVLRVESLFGEPGTGGARRGSVGVIVQRILAGEEVPVFTDRVASPAGTADIARATRLVIERHAPPGLYHCVNSGHANWAGIALEASRLLDRPLRMKPITLESVQLKAPRPHYCALSNRKLVEAGIAMPTWQEALASYLARAVEPGGARQDGPPRRNPIRR
jgi:dTDP-4-dehydrorhamnose reductase